MGWSRTIPGASPTLFALLCLTARLAALGGRITTFLKERLIRSGEREILSTITARKLNISGHVVSSGMSSSRLYIRVGKFYIRILLNGKNSTCHLNDLASWRDPAATGYSGSASRDIADMKLGERTGMSVPDPEFEAECIRRILAGEKHLFHELIRPCERSIYFLLLSLLKNETDVEDAAQETVIKVYQNLDKFRGDSQFRTWVLSIARNEGLGRLRKIGSRREDSLDAEIDGSSGDYTPAILTSWREIPAEALEQKELGAILRKAIEGLPEIYRNIVLLRDIEEMDIRQTAARSGDQRGGRQGSSAPGARPVAASPGSATERICPQTKGLVWGTRMRIDCKHVWEHISAYIDGEVDASLRAEIDRHLETCEICSAVLDSTRNVVILVADERVFELPAGFSERLHARIDRELEAPGG